MIGKKLSQYEITAFLGKGGMGEVYQARDTRLDRDVALKVLPAEFARDADRLARFRREAKMLASLNHPNIAAIHGLDEDNGQIFLAMELVEGEDLSQQLRSGPLALEDVLDIARQLAEGLEEAHDRGVVHRDLKPANLKVTPAGQVKILDFGLARAYLGEEESPDDPLNSPTMTAALTEKGMILGTAAYMSPEQARGRPVDHRSDIWAFGAILFEMLTGRRLFEGETISDTVAAVLRADMDWDLLPDDTPGGVRRLLIRCLERDGRRRLRDIGEARVRLERWREDPASIHESVSMMASDLAPLPGSRPWLPWALCLVAVATAAFLGLQLKQTAPPPANLMSFEIDVPGEASINTVNRNNVLASDDGKLLAWITNHGIYVRQIGQREALLLEGTENATSADFSPDNRWIGFVARGRLQRISVAGGAPFDVCEVPTVRGIAWVDESTIVFAGGISTGLQMVSLADGVPQVLTTTDSSRNERSHRWPTTVPGRRAVLFECQYLGRDYDQSDIQLISLDDKERRTVHRGGAAPVCTEAGHLFFARSKMLYAIAFDRNTGETTGLPVPVLEDLATSVGNQEDDDGSAQFAIDRKGSLFYLDNGGANRRPSRLTMVDTRTNELDPIGSIQQQRDLLVSPNGRLVAISRGEISEEDLYIIDLDTGGEVLLTRRRSVEYLGAWSPDSQILYWSQASDDGASFEILRRRVDGATPAEHVTTMPPGGGAYVTGISPDGRKLLIESWAGTDHNNIVILDLENPAEPVQRFIDSPDKFESAVFVGDGSFVLYFENVGNRMLSLFLRQYPDTGAVWSFVGPEKGYYDAWWNANAGGVVAVSDDGLVLLPLALNENGAVLGPPETIVKPANDGRAKRIISASMHPSGERIALLLAEETVAEVVEPSLVYISGWEQVVAGTVSVGR